MAIHQKISFALSFKAENPVGISNILIRAVLLICAAFLSACELRLETTDKPQSQESVEVEHAMGDLVVREEPTPKSYLLLICDVSDHFDHFEGRYFLKLMRDPSKFVGFDSIKSYIYYYETGDDRIFTHQLSNRQRMRDGFMNMSLGITDEYFRWYFFNSDRDPDDFYVSRYDLNVYASRQLAPSERPVGSCRETSGEDYLDEWMIAEEATSEFRRSKEEAEQTKLEGRII